MRGQRNGSGRVAHAGLENDGDLAIARLALNMFEMRAPCDNHRVGEDVPIECTRQRLFEQS